MLRARQASFSGEIALAQLTWYETTSAVYPGSVVMEVVMTEASRLDGTGPICRIAVMDDDAEDDVVSCAAAV